MFVDEVKEIRKIEKDIEKKRMRVQELSKELSKELGTPLLIGEYMEEYDITVNLSVELPRISGKGKVGFFGPIELRDSHVTEIIYKLREFEKLAEEFLKENSISEDDLELDMEPEEFLEKPLEEIFEIWKEDFEEEIEEYDI